MYDIIIRNGRVIDPQNKFDAKADVAIYNGKIVGVGDYQNAESDRVLDAAGHIVTPGLIDAPRASVAADQNGHFHRMHLYPQRRHNGRSTPAAPAGRPTRRAAASSTPARCA